MVSDFSKPIYLPKKRASLWTVPYSAGGSSRILGGKNSLNTVGGDLPPAPLAPPALSYLIALIIHYFVIEKNDVLMHWIHFGQQYPRRPSNAWTKARKKGFWNIFSYLVLVCFKLSNLEHNKIWIPSNFLFVWVLTRQRQILSSLWLSQK